ncbi:MAG TPA: hypothetical protein VNI01_08790 [Elusimicrobiota bacterium]|nr:hypothetical protein [Elusimicrobiota bacterium]
MNKTSWRALAACAALFALCAGAFAQDQGSDAGPGGEAAKQAMIKKAAEMYRKGGDEGPDPASETEHYARNLSLTEQQRADVLKILEDRRKIFRESAKVRREFKEETEKLHQRILAMNEKVRQAGVRIDAKQKQALGQIRALLTKDQQSRFDMMEKERARMEAEFRERQIENYRREHPGEGPHDGQGDPMQNLPEEPKK